MKPEQRETFAKAQAETKRFVEFRTELARLGHEVSPAKSREFGDNDAKRSNHQQLNAVIQQVAASDQAEYARLDQEFGAFYATRLPLPVGGSLAAIAIGLAVALLVAHRLIAGPLVKLGATIEKLAASDTDIVAEGADRKDEVGRIAKTLEVFKAGLIGQRDAQKKERTDVTRHLAAVGASGDGLNESASTIAAA